MKIRLTFFCKRYIIYLIADVNFLMKIGFVKTILHNEDRQSF